MREQDRSAEDAPQFRLLSDEKIQRIHEASLEVLEEVGVRITTEEARTLLADAGCDVADNEIVKIPRRVVEDAIVSAPKRVVLYDRDGEAALYLEGKNCYFGMGITAIHFRDPVSGERRDARIEDMALATRVADALPNLDLVATPMVVKSAPGMPQQIVNQCEFQAMVTNTTKPLFVLVENSDILGDVLDMAAAVRGGPEAFRERPFVVPYLNNVSPLVYNVETLDKLLLSADRGAPVRCCPAPMAGATTPVTLAGTLACTNAETLVGSRHLTAPMPWGPVHHGRMPEYSGHEDGKHRRRARGNDSFHGHGGDGPLLRPPGKHREWRR